MATYYRWRKSSIKYESAVVGTECTGFYGFTCYILDSRPSISGRTYDFSHAWTENIDFTISSGKFVSDGRYPTRMFETTARNNGFYANGSGFGCYAAGRLHEITAVRDAELGYVYSTDPSAYPENGVYGDYYYDQRETVTSPSAPTGLTYPNPITSTPVTVSWNEATSNTDYPIEIYDLKYQKNGSGTWTSMTGVTAPNTSRSVNIPSDTTTIQFQVRAKDSNDQYSDFITGPVVSVTLVPFSAPTITASTTAIEGVSVSLSWNAVNLATGYKLQRNTGGEWTDVYTGADRSFSEVVGHWTTLKYRVQATNAKGAGPWSAEKTISVSLSPTLTVPQLLMQGQQAAVFWTAISEAESYTLQRKANTDADWTQVYSGANLSYTETVGTWTSLQYRVQAVFSGTPGGWAESAAIPVVSSSALVISGTDGDLGTVVNDIPYSISTDTGNQITATITVNSAVIFSGNVGNSTSDTIPVLDLVNGTGTIVIEASVTASGGPVSAVRTWTYTKTPITFPNAGSVAQLTQEGENIFPKTMAECVRLPGGKTLDEVTAFPAQVYTGSYVGTGTYGASNPTTLSFPFEPKMVIIAANAYQGGITHPLIRPDTVGYVTIAASIYSTMVVSWAGKEISFYDANSAIRQFNNSGTTYYYIALG